MAVIGLGVNSNHVGDIWTLNKASVEKMLPQVVKFVGHDSATDSEGIVSFFSYDSIGHLGKPPNSCITADLPFLYHWFLAANSERLIQERNIIKMPTLSHDFTSGNYYYTLIKDYKNMIKGHNLTFYGGD